MDTDVVEHAGSGTALGRTAVVGPKDEPGTPEVTIGEVDHLLDGVEAALTRLDEGTYGTCSTCGRAIDDARLAEDPTILTCGGCPADAPRSEPGDAAVAGRVPFGDGTDEDEADDEPVAGAMPGDVARASDGGSPPAAEPGPSWD